MVKINKNRTKKSGKKQKPVEQLNMSLKDIYGMFWILVAQNEQDGNVMCFPLEIFQGLPKSPKLSIVKKDGCLIVTIPDDSDGLKKSDIILPEKNLILRKG